eukprot:SM000134S26976  [mRNA]  locus=s134:366494:368248:- [translate_table: standard]
MAAPPLAAAAAAAAVSGAPLVEAELAGRRRRPPCAAPLPSSARPRAAAAGNSAGSSIGGGGGAGGGGGGERAAFFDVDGTLAASNVVAAYAVARWRELAPAARAAWLPFFAGKALAYLALDAADRAAFNRAFYRNYAGRAASSKPAMAALVHQQYLAPRSFSAAQAHVRSLKQQGFRIVLVTGGLDFLVAPLAAEIAADAVFAASLVEEGGRFTGELQGAALGSAEKGKIVRAYAAENDIPLASCHAYGDSIADLAMLESVGHPHAVRPDARLKKIAVQRSWPIIDWSTPTATAINSSP